MKRGLKNYENRETTKKKKKFNSASARSSCKLIILKTNLAIVEIISAARPSLYFQLFAGTSCITFRKNSKNCLVRGTKLRVRWISIKSLHRVEMQFPYRYGNAPRELFISGRRLGSYAPLRWSQFRFVMKFKWQAVLTATAIAATPLDKSRYGTSYRTRVVHTCTRCR